jgi:hypothetical protein
LIIENRKDIGTSDDDLIHVRAQKDSKPIVSSSQKKEKINPQAPTGLVPSPTT